MKPEARSDADLTALHGPADHGTVLLSYPTKALLAGLPPLLIYLGTASGYGYWFDSGEFVAAAADFGVSHPPGQPLSALLLGVANLLPIGSLAFRVAAMCATFGALAAVALCFALEHTLRSGDVVRPELRYPLALGTTWWVAASHAWWFQAVRPEVYSLQAALMCLAIERLLWACRGDGHDVRPLYQSALAFGLALSNHHYLALLGALPAVWLLVGIWRRFGWKPLAWSTGFVVAGLLTYLYLPLRASTEPFLNLGDPTSPGRFVWVVTAQAFQKSVSTVGTTPFSTRLADVLVVAAEDLHVAMLAFALLGAYFMMRVRAARKFGLFWLTLWLVYILGRAAIGFVHGNPDAVAYFMLSYASIAAFSAFALGVLLSALAEATPARPRLAPLLAYVLALGASFELVHSWDSSSLRGFADTDVFDDGLRRSLPVGAVVLAHNPQTIFRLWGGEAEELNRPDVTMVPLPLLGYPKLVDRLAAADPELKPLLRNYLLNGALGAADLQSLATLRPVYVEMDVRVDPEMMELLLPEQLYYRVLTADAVALDEVTAIREQAALWGDIYRRVGHPVEEATATQLLWRHYADALYFAAMGATDAAMRAARDGLALNPHARELRMLRKTLERSTPGERIDISEFVVR